MRLFRFFAFTMIATSHLAASPIMVDADRGFVGDGWEYDRSADAWHPISNFSNGQASDNYWSVGVQQNGCTVFEECASLVYSSDFYFQVPQFGAVPASVSLLLDVSYLDVYARPITLHLTGLGLNDLAVPLSASTRLNIPIAAAAVLPGGLYQLHATSNVSESQCCYGEWLSGSGGDVSRLVINAPTAVPEPRSTAIGGAAALLLCAVGNRWKLWPASARRSIKRRAH